MRQKLKKNVTTANSEREREEGQQQILSPKIVPKNCKIDYSDYDVIVYR